MLRQITLWMFVVFMLASHNVQAQVLASHTDVITGPPTWIYTLFNDEPLASPNYVTSFTLAVNAPVTVTGTPTGWDFTTDNATYVQWFNTDTALPYPHDIAPGDSLSGFDLQSTATTSTDSDYELIAWDHIVDAPGPLVNGTISAPSTIVVVPEPNVVAMIISGILASVRLLLRRCSFGMSC